MKTYWDYTEKERSEMTHDDVTALLDVELMTKGVKKLLPVELRKIEQIEVAQKIWFECGGILFETAEQAQKFLALLPKKSEYNYSIGYDYHFAEDLDPEIKQVKLYLEQEVLNLATILSRNKESKEYNERITSEFNKAKEEQDKILKGVWEDWYFCGDKAAKFRDILNTRKEYLRMTNNDAKLADDFLRKIYADGEIAEAFNWFDITKEA